MYVYRHTRTHTHSHLLHNDHERSLYVRAGAAMGSEKAKKGSARLAKAFLNSVIFLFCNSLYNSMHTKPVTMAVVVAMAGMILPAISFVLYLHMHARK